jgi:hypothetical protein
LTDTYQLHSYLYILDRTTGKNSRYSFRGLTKEFDCYHKVTELVNSGKDVSVFNALYSNPDYVPAMNHYSADEMISGYTIPPSLFS